jgi:hypothetical protein
VALAGGELVEAALDAGDGFGSFEHFLVGAGVLDDLFGLAVDSQEAWAAGAFELAMCSAVRRLKSKREWELCGHGRSFDA